MSEPLYSSSSCVYSCVDCVVSLCVSDVSQTGEELLSNGGQNAGGELYTPQH